MIPPTLSPSSRTCLIRSTILAAAAPPDLPLTFRPMFGGILAYVDGKAFASLSNVGLALKLAGENHSDFLALPGAKPLRYDPDAPIS